MSESAGNAAAIGSRLGRYEVGARLGAGGMAEVFQATDTTLGRQVAVKVIAPAYAADRQFRERFLREAKVIAALDHPHIVPIFDVGEEAGLPYLVMPLVPGGTLASRLRQGPLPLEQAVVWVAQLAGALDAAHQAGILHRDIKPGNVLVGQNGRLLLADFGIAHLGEAATRLTRTGMVVGTPVYMAPEIAQGRNAAPASDLYSLAVLAFEMIAGRPPFDGENVLSILHQHATQPPPPLQTFVAQLPEGIDPVILNGLAKNPAERPSSCTLFAESLIRQIPTVEARMALSSGIGSGMVPVAASQLTPSPATPSPATPTPGQPASRSTWNATTLAAANADAPTLADASVDATTLARPSWNDPSSSAVATTPLVAANPARASESRPAAPPAPAESAARAENPPRQPRKKRERRKLIPWVALAILGLWGYSRVVRNQGAPATSSPAPTTAAARETATATPELGSPARPADPREFTTPRNENPAVPFSSATAPNPRPAADSSQAGEDLAEAPAAVDPLPVPPSSPQPPAPSAATPAPSPNFEDLLLVRELARMPKLAALRQFEERTTAEGFQRSVSSLAIERQRGGPRATLLEPLARFAEGGLAHAQGDDAAAREALAALAQDPRFATFMGASPPLMLTPGQRAPGPYADWELALGYGDPRRVAADQIAAARKRSADSRLVLAQAVVHRLDHQSGPALTLAAEAYGKLLGERPALAAVAALLVADQHLADHQLELAAQWYQSALAVRSPHQGLVVLQSSAHLREKGQAEMAQQILSQACELGLAFACKNANERPTPERPRRRPGQG